MLKCEEKEAACCLLKEKDVLAVIATRFGERLIYQ